MTFLLRIKLLKILLLSGFILFAKTTSALSTPEKISSTPYLEAYRINPEAFELPMKIKPYLSGNFAELRNNHLHSGLDFKTNLSIGIPVYAIADGWISRIRISAYGFGYALYIDHPNGFTTVYGHLNGYISLIDSFAKNAQYKREQFELDTMLKRGQIPVKKNQIIAYSGNSGGSAAPHLHFEIRDTKTEETIDPLLWYNGRIQDKTAPRFQRLVFYAMDGEGICSSGLEKTLISTVKSANGIWNLNGKTPTAWGKIGLGLSAYDFMDGTNNQYGVSNIRLYLEEEEIFNQDFSRFAFSQTRYVNSLTDYEAWRKNRIWIIKSFLEPENRLNVYLTSKNRGYVQINEEKIYHLKYIIQDRAGNTSEIRFNVQGLKAKIPVAKIENNRMESWLPNRFNCKDLELTIPAGYLFKSINFNYQQLSSNSFSDIYILQDTRTPLFQSVPVKFRIQKDNLSNKSAYYVARQDDYGHYQYVGGTWSDGMIQANIREFGKFTVMADTIPPKIVGLNLENAVKNRLFRIRISDNASGIKSWRATIDGNWALFEMDGKTALLKYKIDDNRLIKGKNHILLLVVKDACGNESRFEHQFYY